MKKILLISFTLLIFQAANAQVVTAPPSGKISDKELGMQYLKKSRQLKIAGWAMLGTGIILTVVGSNEAATNWDSDAGYGLFLAGTFLTIGSIPCFVIGAKNKGRAEILLRNENMMVSLTPNTLKAVPSLTLAVKIK